MKIILLKISVGLVLFFTVIYMCINTAALEDTSPETLCDYTDFHMEYYYTTPPENGEYFYIGQEGRSEPDEVIQVTIRFVNDGKYPIDIDNMVITENDIVFCTAEDYGKKDEKTKQRCLRSISIETGEMKTLWQEEVASF